MVLHVTLVDPSGGLWHTARRADGSWLAFTNVIAEVLRLNPGAGPGKIVDVACSGVGNDLQICITTETAVLHTMRTISGLRAPFPFPFGDLLGAAQAPRGLVWSIATAGTGTRGALDVCLALQTVHPPLVSTVRSLHGTVRLASGSWKSFQDRGGSFSDIASAIAGTTYHYVGVSFDARGTDTNRLQHAVGTYPSALTFRDAGAQVHIENPTAPEPGIFNQVSCAGEDDGTLHLITASGGRVFRTMRRPNGTWAGFENVVEEVQREHPGSAALMAVGSVGCAVVNGELQVACVDGNGVLWHSIRRAVGSWFAFGNVLAEVAREHPGSPGPTAVATVAVADSF